MTLVVARQLTSWSHGGETAADVEREYRLSGAAERPAQAVRSFRLASAGAALSGQKGGTEPTRPGFRFFAQKVRNKRF